MPPRKKKTDATEGTPIPPEKALLVLDEEPQAREDFYKKIRRQIRRWLGGKEGKGSRWSDIVMFAPDIFHLLIRLVADPAVGLANRMRLAAAAAYFMSPLDLIPELLTGPLGFLDDIALAAYVLHRIINTSDRAIVERHWAGDGDLLKLLRRVLRNTNAMLGGLVAGRIERLARWAPRPKAK